MTRSLEVRRALARGALIAVVYFALVKLSFLGMFIAVGPAPIWLPPGFGIAMLLIHGIRYWPAITVGSALATTVYRAPLVAHPFIVLAHTVEALTGAYLMLRLFKFRPAFARFKDVLALVFGGSLGGAVNSFISVTALCATGAMEWSNYGHEWAKWWTPGALSILILTPLILAWSHPGHRARPLRVNGEFMLIMLLSLPAVYLVFFAQVGEARAFAYVLYPFVIWIAIRTGLRAMIVANFVFTGLAIWSAAIGMGPFLHENPQQGLLYTQAFLVVTVVTGLSLAAFAQESAYLTRLLESVLQQNPLGIILVEESDGGQASFNDRAQELLGDQVRSVATLKELRARLDARHLDGRPLIFEEWPLVRSLLRREKVDKKSSFGDPVCLPVFWSSARLPFKMNMVG